MKACCKVGKIIERHNLSTAVANGNIDEYLAARWTGANEYSETGIRPLTDWFNQKVLKTIYTAAGRETAGRLESDYELLTGEECDDRYDVIASLETDGIDAEEVLKSELISTTSLYRHFKNCLEQTKSRQKAETEWEINAIDHLQKNLKSDVDRVLKSLENKDELPQATSADISTSVLLGCPVCGKSAEFKRVIDRGYVCSEHMSESSESLEEREQEPGRESVEGPEPISEFSHS